MAISNDEPTASLTTTDGRYMELTGTAAAIIDGLSYYIREANEIGLPGEGGGSVEFHVESASKPIQVVVSKSRRVSIKRAAIPRS